MTSTDIGVMEKTTTPEGWSIAKNGIGCNRDEFLWQTSKLSTPGRENQLQTTTCEVAFINEFHYKNAGEDEGEFIEVASNTDEIDLYSIVLYDSTDGRPYDAIDLAAFQQGQTTSEGLTFYFYEFATPTLSNNEALFNNAIIPGNGSGIVLAKDGVVVEFLSYEGVFEATAGVAENMTSTPIGVSQFDTTPVGSSLQLRGEGCAPKNFQWWSIEADANIRDTRGAVNTEQDIDCQQFPFVPTEPPSIETFDDDLIYGDDDFLDDVVYVPPDKKKRSSKSRS